MTVPSPGAVVDEDHNLLPASYLNFYIANTVVVVPVFGGPADDFAVGVLSKLFPRRRVVGLPSNATLTGGEVFTASPKSNPSWVSPNSPHDALQRRRRPVCFRGLMFRTTLIERETWYAAQFNRAPNRLGS